MTVGFFLAVALMGALAYWLLFKFWPAWLLEQEKHREHLANALAKRGAEAQEDIAAASKLHESQQTTLVKELGGRIDKTHEKIRRSRQGPRHRGKDRRHRARRPLVRRASSRASRSATRGTRAAGRGSREV